MGNESLYGMFLGTFRRQYTEDVAKQAAAYHARQHLGFVVAQLEIPGACETGNGPGKIVADATSSQDTLSTEPMKVAPVFPVGTPSQVKKSSAKKAPAKVAKPEKATSRVPKASPEQLEQMTKHLMSFVKKSGEYVTMLQMLASCQSHGWDDGQVKRVVRGLREEGRLISAGQARAMSYGLPGFTPPVASAAA
jgi:hypothetical protein